MRISKPIRWLAACLWVVLALEGCAGGQAPPSADVQATPPSPGDASADSTKDTKLSDLPDLPDTAAAEVKTELPVQDVADPWAVEVYDVDPSEDKSCHYDCFGQMYCINGQVFSQYHAPVACSDWQGACPTAPPLNCPNGCLPKGPTSVGYAGDPTTLCNPCPSQYRMGPNCETCVNPLRLPPDCTECSDPEIHGPGCDQCLAGPGSPGCPCSNDIDCNIGGCHLGSSGKRCASACVYGGCSAPGTACVTSPPAPQLCIPKTGKLCTPCTSNAECAILGHAGDTCTPLGGKGSVCTLKCGSYFSACPPEFSCQTVKDVTGAAASQCVPISGVCLASYKFP